MFCGKSNFVTDVKTVINSVYLFERVQRMQKIFILCGVVIFFQLFCAANCHKFETKYFFPLHMFQMFHPKMKHLSTCKDCFVYQMMHFLNCGSIKREEEINLLIC